MKKFLGLVLMFLVSVASAQLHRDSVGISTITWDNDAISIYYVGIGTETTASVDITESSITFHVADGLVPGTTGFSFDSPTYNTIDELIAQVELLDETTSYPGLSGDWTLTVLEGMRGEEDSRALIATEETTVWLATGVATFDVKVASANYISLDLPTPHSSKRIWIHDILCSATFASGATVLNILNDGVAQINDIALATGVEKHYPTVGSQFPIAIGDGGESLEVRITHDNTAGITAGYIIVRYELK